MSPRRKFQQKSITSTLEATGSVARSKELLAKGYSTRAIQDAIASGQIQQLGRGIYALPDATAEEKFLAAHQARRTCLSKAAEIGLWVLEEPKKLHVAVAHGRPVPGCVIHRVRGGQSLTDILRQCIRCGSEVQGLAVLESAVFNQECSINHLRKSFSGRADSKCRALVEMIDPQSMSLPEMCGRYHLRKAGYNVQGQAYIRSAGHMDLLVDGVLGLEIDSIKYHNNPKSWQEDLRRDTMYVLEGMWRLRIPAAVAMYQPEVLLSWVKQALERIRSMQRWEMR